MHVRVVSIMYQASQALCVKKKERVIITSSSFLDKASFIYNVYYISYNTRRKRKWKGEKADTRKE
jgi:hypothetical protein